MPSPSVSLYKLTLPPVIGVSRASQAALIPSTTSENCHMMVGFSGLPKFRQLVAATGVAPVQETLRADSATACMAPSLGESHAQRPLPSRAIASPRLLPFSRITPASAPGPSTVFDCTMVSYCSNIQRLEHMLAAPSRRFKMGVKSPVLLNVMCPGLVCGTGASQGDMGR